MDDLSNFHLDSFFFHIIRSCRSREFYRDFKVFFSDAVFYCKMRLMKDLSYLSQNLLILLLKFARNTKIVTDESLV